MKRLFVIFILSISFIFANNLYKQYYYFHNHPKSYLSKQRFLYKMANFNPHPGFYDFLSKISNKYFNISYKNLIPVKLPNAHISNYEFIKLPKYGHKIYSYMGVWERANNFNMSKHYQCSELVNRFYRKVFHIKVIQRNGIVTAKEYNGLKSTYNGLPIEIIYYPLIDINLKVKPLASFPLSKIFDIHRKGNIYIYNKSFNKIFQKHPPTNGTILSFANNFHSKSGIYFGHTAIVKKIVKIKNGYRIYCFEQNVIKRNHTIAVNRYITFIKHNDHWEEIGSGILDNRIGRIGPVIGWSKPYYIKYIHIINKNNFYQLINKLIKSKYFNLDKYQNNILKPIKNYNNNYIANSLYNKVIYQFTLAEKLKNETGWSLKSIF